MDTLGTQVTAAAVVSFLIGFLKKQSWFPWLTAESEKANRIAAVVLSGLAALGIHAQYTHAAGTLVITGLTLTTILSGAWHWLTQFAITHGWFKATSSSDELVCLIKAYLQAQKTGPAPPAV